jgi:hypothetical protein
MQYMSLLHYTANGWRCEGVLMGGNIKKECADMLLLQTK